MGEARCCARVWDGPFSSSCGRRASLQHDGRDYCKMHHPPTRDAKRKEKDEARAAQWERDDKDRKERAKHAAEMKRRAECFDELTAALTNLAALYDTDEGCRSAPEYIAACAALARARGEG